VAHRSRVHVNFAVDPIDRLAPQQAGRAVHPGDLPIPSRHTSIAAFGDRRLIDGKEAPEG
jgi:hypothetical protein